MQQDRADKNVEGAATDEGEEKRGVARDLRWDLEFEETGSYKLGGIDRVSFAFGNSDAMVPSREKDAHASKGRGNCNLTSTEDDNVDSNNDGLAIFK